MIRPTRRLRRAATVTLVTALTLGWAGAARAQQGDAPGRKSPGVALALSVLLPGGGQIYNGHHLKAAGMLGGAALTVGPLILTVSDVLGLDDDRSGTGTHLLGAAGMAVILWSWIDAPLSARAINRRLEAGSMSVDVGPRVLGSPVGTGIAVSLVTIRF